MLRERNCSVKPRSEQSILKAQSFAHKILDCPLTLSKSEG